MRDARALLSRAMTDTTQAEALQALQTLDNVASGVALNRPDTLIVMTATQTLQRFIAEHGDGTTAEVPELAAAPAEIVDDATVAALADHQPKGNRASRRAPAKRAASKRTAKRTTKRT